MASHARPRSARDLGSPLEAARPGDGLPVRGTVSIRPRTRLAVSVLVSHIGSDLHHEAGIDGVDWEGPEEGRRSS